MNSERPAVVITRQRRTLKKYHGNYRNRVEIVFMRVTGHVEEEERQRSRGETSGCKTQNDREMDNWNDKFSRCIALAFLPRI